MIELEISYKGTNTKALVLCDKAYSNSCMSSSLVKRLHLEGQDLKLTVNRINTTEVNHCQKAEITVSSKTAESKIAFEVSVYVRETLSIGSETIDVASL